MNNHRHNRKYTNSWKTNNLVQNKKNKLTTTKKNSSRQKLKKFKILLEFNESETQHGTQ